MQTFTFDITVLEKEFTPIYTVADLYNVRNDLTANYILMNDIDLSVATADGGDYDFNGNGWNPIGSNDIYDDLEFSGIFNGNGYTISGMRIALSALPSGSNAYGIYLGLFANVSGTVKNLKIRWYFRPANRKQYLLFANPHKYKLLARQKSDFCVKESRHIIAKSPNSHCWNF